MMTAALSPGIAALILFGVERIRADLRIVIYGPGPESRIDAHRDIGTGSVV